MPTEADVLEWLRVCFDPELPVNIVDLGLVQQINVALDKDAPGTEPRYRVSVQLTMRAANDEREAMLLGQVRNRLAGIHSVSRAEVTLCWHPAWTPERMTPAAREALGLVHPVNSSLVQIRL